MNVTKRFPLLLVFLSMLLLTPACTRTLAPDGAYKGDQVLYEADNSILTGKQLLDTFVNWEKTNRQFLWQTDKGVKKAADYVRANAKEWVRTSINLREAYALNPTPEKRDALQTSLNVINQALAEALKYLTQYGPGKKA